MRAKVAAQSVDDQTMLWAAVKGLWDESPQLTLSVREVTDLDAAQCTWTAV